MTEVPWLQNVPALQAQIQSLPSRTKSPLQHSLLHTIETRNTTGEQGLLAWSSLTGLGLWPLWNCVLKWYLSQFLSLPEEVLLLVALPHPSSLPRPPVTQTHRPPCFPILTPVPVCNDMLTRMTRHFIPDSPQAVNSTAVEGFSVILLYPQLRALSTWKHSKNIC